MLRHFYSIALCTLMMFTCGQAMALATAEFATAESGDRVRQLVSQRLETEATMRNDARIREIDRENKMLSLQVVKRRARFEAARIENPSSFDGERMGLLGFVTCLPLGLGYGLFALTRRTMRRRDLERSRIFGNRPEALPNLPEVILPAPANQYVQFLEQVKHQRALLTIVEQADLTPLSERERTASSNVLELPVRGRQDFNASFKLLVAVSKLNLVLDTERRSSKSAALPRSLNFNQLLEEVPELRIQRMNNDRKKAV